jgi:F-type H+-transporting ATPase subunit b
MPQLQPGDFAPQLVWLAITFALLYFLLSRLALPRIEQVIGERKSLISGDLLKAREAQRQSEEEMARYEAEIASAKAKAQANVRAAQEKLDAELAKKRSALEEEAAAKIGQAEEKIHGLLERASADMERITSDVVNDIVKELAGVEVTEAEVRTALRQGAKE